MCADFGDTFSVKCYWSEADCDESAGDIHWIEAGSNSKCTCEETLTGACENSGNYYCAVSELGCDKDTAFVPVANLSADMTCFLCEKLDETTIELKSQEIIVPPPAKPQITMQTQTTSLPQGQPTISPVIIPETVPPASAPETHHHHHDDSGSFYHEENEGLTIFVAAISTLPSFICCAISCTGSPKSKYRRAVDEDEGLVPNPIGELA